jgi:hypothetical protein
VERLPVVEEPINMVEARFYFLIDEAPSDLPARYLAIARRHLPEALPAKFGWSGNLKRDEDQAFIDLFDDIVDGRNISATPPYPFYHLSFPALFGEHMVHDTSAGREGDVQALSATLQASPLFDPFQREAFRRFFIDLATETASSYAEAKVDDRYIWNGRKATASLKRSLNPDFYQKTSFGKWLGLPERPAWWTWFSPHYTDVVRPRLTGQVEAYPAGILHSFSDNPVLEEQILQALPAGTTWLPTDLTVRAQLHEKPVPLAASIPERLTDMLVPIASA